MTPHLDNWLRLFETRQQVFVTHDLKRAISYLYNARNPGEGWGAYPGLPSDLHHSALAIEALYHSGDETAIAMIADAALYLRRENGNHLEQLNLEELTDLLMVVRSEQQPDDDYTQQLLKALQQVYDAIAADKEEPSARNLYSALLALLESSRAPVSLIQPWTDRLLNLQRSDDGSWPAIAGESGSVIATALAVRVLTHLEEDRAREPLQRGLQYLQNCLDEGWQNLGTDGDTFAQAVVLRALAEVPATQYKWIQDGVDTLLDLRNADDGGWGGGPNEPGNVECTAICVLALVSAGENRFVPARMAEAALHDVQHQVIQVTNERDQLRQGIERKVQQHCGKVVQERDLLRQDNKKLKKQQHEVMQTAREQVRRAKEEVAESEQLVFELERFAPYVGSDYSTFHGWSFLDILTHVILGVLAAVAVWQLWELPLPLWKILTIGLITSTVGLLVLVRFRQKRAAGVSKDILSDMLRKLHRKAEPSHLSMLRSRFMDMTDSWPRNLREELVYRLFSDMIDLPPDIGRRYAEDFAARFDLPSSEAHKLQLWVEYVTRLRPSERRILFDQLRRGILR